MLQKLSNLQMKHWAWVIPILLLATVLIFTHLTTDAYWADEGATLRNIGAPPYPTRTMQDLVFHMGLSEWPPAYFISVLAWGNAVGWSEFATRYLGLLISILSIALMYRLGRMMYRPQTGLIAAFLLATSVYFIFYAHELRGYTLYILLTITSIFLYWYIIHRQSVSIKALIAFVISCILLIYTHYMAICIFATIGQYHLLFGRRYNNWKKVFVSLAVVSIAYLPWLAIAILNVLEVSRWEGGQTAQVLVATLVNSTSNTLWFVAIAALLASLFFCRTRATLSLWFIALISLAVILGANAVSPFIFNARHTIGALPFLILLIAVGLNYQPYATHLVTILVLCIWMSSGIWLNRNLDYPQSLPGSTESIPIETMHTARNVVDTCVQPEDTIVTFLTRGNGNWDEHVLVYYLADEDDRYNLALANFLTHIDTSHPPVDNVTPFETRFQNLTENSQSTWVLVSPFARPQPQLAQTGALLTEAYASCGQIIDTLFFSAYLYQNTADVSCNLPLINPQSLPNCSTNLLEDFFETETLQN